MAEKEYIERDGLVGLFLEKCFKDTSSTITYSDVIQIINAYPRADVQKVKYGKWIKKSYLLDTSNFCSVCGDNFGMPHGKFNICPNCGAKMDEE